MKENADWKCKQTADDFYWERCRNLPTTKPVILAPRRQPMSHSKIQYLVSGPSLHIKIGWRGWWDWKNWEQVGGVILHCMLSQICIYAESNTDEPIIILWHADYSNLPVFCRPAPKLFWIRASSVDSVAAWRPDSDVVLWVHLISSRYLSKLCTEVYHILQTQPPQVPDHSRQGVTPPVGALFAWSWDKIHNKNV